MSLLAPLGLLGLLAVAVLIFIYIIKPNYQQKIVSSTYIWKRSLKYRKKRVPVSRLRNILIFLCQMLVLASFAMLLARPVIPYVAETPKNEKVIILDASAGMRVSTGGETRFERAVREIRRQAESILSQDDMILSVIVADSDAHYLVSRQTRDGLAAVGMALDSLVSPELKCSYGTADMEGAATLAQDILKKNSETEVILYTATEYIDKGNFTVVNVADESDWNAAILYVKPTLEESNSYSFTVGAGCYGQSRSMTVYCELTGINGGVGTLKVSKTEYFTEAESERELLFTTDDFGGVPVTSYASMLVYLDENDSFDGDNTYDVYGGQKHTVRIQYASSQTNNFFSGVLRSLRQAQRGSWNIELKTTNKAAAATEGFDIYIFEGAMPDVLPTDGVVMLVNPDKAPEGSGLRFGDRVNINSDSTLASGQASPITANMNPDRITVAEYREVLSADGYDELMYYNGNPVILAKDEENAHVVVLSLNLKMSSLGVVLDFPIMMYNIFNHYIPVTLTGNAYEVGETVTVNGRGSDLTVSGGGNEAQSFATLPGTLTPTVPGGYTVTQKNLRGEYVVDQFFVHIPNSESNITKRVDELPRMYAEKTQVDGDRDLLVWFAAAAVAELQGGISFVPKIKDQTAVFEGLDSSAVIPALKGYYGTKVKDGARVPLIHDYVPIYAEWDLGAGRVGSFLCDLGGEWSAEFMADAVGRTIVRNISYDLAPDTDLEPDAMDYVLRTDRDNYTTRLDVYTATAEGEKVSVTVMPVSESAKNAYNGNIPVTALGNGISFTFEIKHEGLYRVSIAKTDAAGQTLSSVSFCQSFSYSEEYNAFREEGEGAALLAEVAADGGGRVLSDPVEVFSYFVRFLPRETDPRMVFLIIAMVCLLLDVAVRKFKFKWIHEIVRDRRAMKTLGGGGHGAE